MTADRWIFALLGTAVILFIIWFFWLKRTTGLRATETTGGYQEAMILVKGGYTPDTVIFTDFQKSADLPTGQTVPVEFLPKEPGEFAFGCPMGMFRGRLIVE